MSRVRGFRRTSDPAWHVLRYLNAGHNAPIVLRTGNEVVRPDIGGSVVGLMRNGEWEQVSLNRGDLFVAFTDGISEARNDANDE